MKRTLLIVWRWALVAYAVTLPVRAWSGTLDRTVAAGWLVFVVVTLTVEAIQHTRRKPPAAPTPERVEVEIVPGVFYVAPPGTDLLTAAAAAHEAAARIREAGR